MYSSICMYKLWNVNILWLILHDIVLCRMGNLLPFSTEESSLYRYILHYIQSWIYNCGNNLTKPFLLLFSSILHAFNQFEIKHHCSYATANSNNASFQEFYGKHERSNSKCWTCSNYLCRNFLATYLTQSPLKSSRQCKFDFIHWSLCDNPFPFAKLSYHPLPINLYESTQLSLSYIRVGPNIDSWIIRLVSLLNLGLLGTCAIILFAFIFSILKIQCAFHPFY